MMVRRMLTMTTVGLIATLAGGCAIQAQGRGSQAVPPGHLPPPGLCRVWYDNRAPGRQPDPTTCHDAERQAAGRNARVIYGEARYGDRRYDRRNDRPNDRRDDRRDDRGEPGRSRVGEPGRGRVGTGTVTGGGMPCADRDRDGYCDSIGRHDMPLMTRTSMLSRTERTATERDWLGDERIVAQYTDRDRNGVPEEILWKNHRGVLVQRWQDHDLDGRVDEIVFYRDGRVLYIVNPNR